MWASLEGEAAWRLLRHSQNNAEHAATASLYHGLLVYVKEEASVKYENMDIQKYLDQSRMILTLHAEADKNFSLWFLLKV